MGHIEFLSRLQFILIASPQLETMTVVEMGSMTHESQTVDEGYHLLAGYQLLKTGRPPAYCGIRSLS